jgi:hypothetical protein
VAINFFCRDDLYATVGLSLKMSRLLIITILGLLSCDPHHRDLMEHLDGWEILTTYKVLPSRAIRVEDKLAKAFKGDNDVLIVELERKPIFQARTRSYRS